MTEKPDKPITFERDGLLWHLTRSRSEYLGPGRMDSDHRFTTAADIVSALQQNPEVLAKVAKACGLMPKDDGLHKATRRVISRAKDLVQSDRTELLSQGERRLSDALLELAKAEGHYVEDAEAEGSE